MKFGKASKKTVALFAAGLVLLGSGGALGTGAVPGVQSDIFDRTIELDSLNVEVVENGKAVGGADGNMGTMLADLSGKKLAVGKEYKEAIGARNTGGYDEYVRIIVRKYWTKDGKKATELTPDLIKLSYDGKDYNTGSWTLDKAASTDEMSIYYYKPVLTKKEPDTALLFDTLSVDASVMDDENVTETKTESGGKTVYTYTYKYDGYTVNVEAEAQSVQTHNAEEAIKSVWGVDAGSVGIEL